MNLKANDVAFKTWMYPSVCESVCACATLYISVEHCVRTVLTVDERPSSTRLSRWVWVSVSISSLVCSSVLLSIRAKHLHEHRYTSAQLCACQQRKCQLRCVDKGCFTGPAEPAMQAGAFQTEKWKTLRRWRQGFTKWQFDLLICLYLSRNWRTKSSNSAEAKHRSFSIWEAQTETMKVL